MQLAGRPLTTALRDVCFLHWPVPEAAVGDRIPDWLTPDVADGTAWISALSMEMRRVDVFGVPVREEVRAVAFRTYVRSPGGDRGVYFLSTDVTDRQTADALERLFRVPGRRASIERREAGEEASIRATRTDAHSSALELTYEPSGPTRAASPDTLASFLTERYRYYVEGALGARLVGNVGHQPWALRSATTSVSENDLVDVSTHGDAGDEPLGHYSDGIQMRLGPPLPLSLVD